eukprot:scaffold109083_cov33-Attheya_sp.AAC.1
MEPTGALPCDHFLFVFERVLPLRPEERQPPIPRGNRPAVVSKRTSYLDAPWLLLVLGSKIIIAYCRRSIFVAVGYADS